MPPLHPLYSHIPDLLPNSSYDAFLETRPRIELLCTVLYKICTCVQQSILIISVGWNMLRLFIIIIIIIIFFFCYEADIVYDTKALAFNFSLWYCCIISVKVH